jgi:phosphoserine phosphatase
LDDIFREDFVRSPLEYSLTERAVVGTLSEREYCGMIEETLGMTNQGDLVRSALRSIIGDLNEEVVDIVRWLAASGYRVACLSNAGLSHLNS